MYTCGGLFRKNMVIGVYQHWDLEDGFEVRVLEAYWKPGPGLEIEMHALQMLIYLLPHHRAWVVLGMGDFGWLN